MEIKTITEHLTGRFSFYAMYPFDTKVIINLPKRDTTTKAAETLGTLPHLRDLLNHRVKLTPSFSKPLTFELLPLSDIFDDSPHAKWSVLRTPFPSSWLDRIWDQYWKNKIPPRVARESIGASLLLYDGGIVILVIEASFNVSLDSGDIPADFPTIIATTLNGTVRYENEPFTDFCEETLNELSRQLREKGEHLHEYLIRDREFSVPEAYPTIVTRIECRPDVPLTSIDLAALASATYLDSSELHNILPSFEHNDCVAVGYDSAWWFSKPTTEYRDRFPQTFAYSLALSMRVYVLNAEVDEKLKSIRNVLLGEPGSEPLERTKGGVFQLRSEIDDIWKQLPLETFSTWVTDIFLFRGILRAWLIEDSAKVLKATLETIHNELVELEQTQLTRLAAIFALASVAGLFLAVLTFGFTQIQWEQASATLQFRALALKLALGLIIIGLLVPISYLLFLPWRKWLFPELSVLRLRRKRKGL